MHQRGSPGKAHLHIPCACSAACMQGRVMRFKLEPFLGDAAGGRALQVPDEQEGPHMPLFAALFRDHITLYRQARGHFLGCCPRCTTWTMS